MNAVVRQHVGLAFGGGGAVAAHGGKDERRAALRFPVVHGRAHDGRDIRDAAAADADGDAGAGLDARSELAGCSAGAGLRPRTSRNGAIGEVLADGEHPGKSHVLRIQPGAPIADRCLDAGVPSLYPRRGWKARTSISI